MTCNAYLARTSTATLALVASGYLAMSGTAAKSDSNKEAAGDGWAVQIWPGASRVASLDDKPTAPNVEAKPEATTDKQPEKKPEKKTEKKPDKKSTGTKDAAKAAKPGKVAANEDLFRSD